MPCDHETCNINVTCLHVVSGSAHRDRVIAASDPPHTGDVVCTDCLDRSMTDLDDLPAELFSICESCLRDALWEHYPELHRPH